MPWLIFSISSISDPESFRKAIFCYQKIRRKILRRLHYELTARPYAPLYFVGEQKNAQNLCANTILLVLIKSRIILVKFTWKLVEKCIFWHLRTLQRILGTRDQLEIQWIIYQLVALSLLYRMVYKRKQITWKKNSNGSN